MEGGREVASWWEAEACMEGGRGVASWWEAEEAHQFVHNEIEVSEVVYTGSVGGTVCVWGGSLCVWGGQCVCGGGHCVCV